MLSVHFWRNVVLFNLPPPVRYNSMDPNSGTFADQEKVFEDAGKPIMDNAFNGCAGKAPDKNSAHSV